MNKSVIFFSNTLIISCLTWSTCQSLHIHWSSEELTVWSSFFHLDLGVAPTFPQGWRFGWDGLLLEVFLCVGLALGGLGTFSPAGTSWRRVPVCTGEAEATDITGLPAEVGAWTGIGKEFWVSLYFRAWQQRKVCILFPNCDALFALSEMHSRKGSNYIHHSTLFCWSRMSSVTLLRISSKLKPDNVFPFLLCTSFMKLMKSELKGKSRKTRLLTGNTMAVINIRERCSFHVWFTAVDALKDTNSANEL